MATSTRSADLDITSILANNHPAPTYRAALTILATLHKTIPGEPEPDGEDPFYVDWDALEERAAPWSTTERLRVRIARSIASTDGDLHGAAWSFDDSNWRALLEALRIAREGR